jgi:hypothetical protein
MKFAKYGGFVGVALAGAGCFLGIGAVQAKTGLSAHDGIYAVHIVTQHGSCHKIYNTKIAVRGNQVHATGHALIQGSGHIAGDRVLVTLRLLHHAVHVRAGCEVILAPVNGRCKDWAAADLGMPRGRAKLERRGGGRAFPEFCCAPTMALHGQETF